ncbi:MAG TPA: ATP-binding cassette domain-containing protein [Puia sp.]|nr:ATP-binding cassette domain-containing protein [Puia sp.]
MNSSLLVINHLCVNINGKKILQNISLKIKKGEQWVIFGEAGTGKTVLGHTLAGNHALSGMIDFKDFDKGAGQNNVMVVEQQHRFRNLQNQSNFYYQQRYNAFDAEATITVEEDISSYNENGYGHLSKTDLLETFHLTPLLKEPLIQLSNGENKRLQILKAVLSFHQLLILDEPFTGLDPDGRRLLDDILSFLSDSGQQLMLLTSRDHIPICFNRYALLKNGELSIIKSHEYISTEENARFKNEQSNQKTLKEFPSAILFSYPDYKYAVRMQDVSIRYGEKNILEAINWEVEKGTCWSLTGHNGAGKSTLLSLITGDNPQAYANNIYLFDRKRGTGESIWEIKQKIGYLSPELHLYFDPYATAFSALASGLFDTIGLFRQMNSLQEKLVHEWLEFLDCTIYSNSLLTSLPSGAQRLILLGRAMIKTPPLLVLDEPCQGLDGSQTAFALKTIDRYCAQYDANLIFVSHYLKDFPHCITHSLQLENGMII